MNANWQQWQDKSYLDTLNQDQVLLEWQRIKNTIDRIKQVEMEMRKYIVSRAFPNKHEGTNTQELGNDYALKAQVKYNYKLADDKEVEKALNAISKIGNEGSFIADRLVTWTADFHLKEYRDICEKANEGNVFAKQILTEFNKVLTITEAAPVLEIKEPKEKKK